MKKIAVVGSMVEAHMLESMLADQGIPHVMKTYHDSAYDGLFQSSKGWGHIEAPEEYAADILTLIENLRAKEQEPAE